jgi:cation diffusion facilitator family transporter
MAARAQRAPRRTVLIALGANASIAVAKLAASLVSGSAAMLAETAHSIADTMNQVFLLFSLKLGEREPDAEHPFGYGKERFFWSFLAAVGIFVAGAGFSRLRGAGVLAPCRGHVAHPGLAPHARRRS